MSRPELPRATARPTLFGAACASEPGAPLRMLALDPRYGPGRRRGVGARRRSAALPVGLGVLLLAAVGAMTVGAPVAGPPAPPLPAPSAAAVVQAPPPSAPGAAALIETIAPAVDPAPAALVRRAAAAPPTAGPAARAAPKQRPSPAPAGAPAPADADVDLLAAMVTRLQAADAVPDPCRTPTPGCPPPAAAVPRSPAR